MVWFDAGIDAPRGVILTSTGSCLALFFGVVGRGALDREVACGGGGIEPPAPGVAADGLKIGTSIIGEACDCGLEEESVGEVF